jgi:hypothetical protein
MEGICPLCLGGEGQNMELKKPVWEWVTQQPLWGKPGIALPWRYLEQAETDSTKRKSSFLTHRLAL